MKMKPITDLEWIGRQANFLEMENRRFLNWVQNQNPVELDDAIHRIAGPVTQHIDCISCGNCCKKLEADISEQELARLAAALGMAAPEFLNKLTSTDLETGDLFMHQQPCIFLTTGNCCSIYPDRPRACHDFPYLLHPDRMLAMERLLSVFGICPIVYNTIQELKAELGFSPC